MFGGNTTNAKQILLNAKGELTMKATGIVRRIDDLGRVVIPKEIRRTQQIREGDPLEIFISADGEVIFKKYSPVGQLSEMAAQCAEVLSKNLNQTVAICDREQIVAAAGAGKKELQDKIISKPLLQLMEQRKNCTLKEEKQYACEGCFRPMLAVAPILVQGDIAGCVVVLAGESKVPQGEAEQQQAALTAGFLAKNMEA